MMLTTMTVSTAWPTTVEPIVRIHRCFPFDKTFILAMAEELAKLAARVRQEACNHDPGHRPENNLVSLLVLPFRVLGKAITIALIVVRRMDARNPFQIARRDPA